MTGYGDIQTLSREFFMSRLGLAVRDDKRVHVMCKGQPQKVVVMLPHNAITWEALERTLKVKMITKVVLDRGDAEDGSLLSSPSQVRDNDNLYVEFADDAEEEDV